MDKDVRKILDKVVEVSDNSTRILFGNFTSDEGFDLVPLLVGSLQEIVGLCNSEGWNLIGESDEEYEDALTEGVSFLYITDTNLI